MTDLEKLIELVRSVADDPTPGAYAPRRTLVMREVHEKARQRKRG